MTPDRLRLGLRTLLVLCVCSLGPACAEGAESLEYQVKAGCLFKFLNFVEWPAHAFKNDRAPIVIGVLGNDPFGEVLDRMMKGRVFGGRKIEVRRYKEAKDAGEAHVLFVGLKGGNLEEALKVLKARPVLTVGESGDFIGSGGVLRFAIRDDKVGFEISAGAARQAGLKIAAQLLNLARVVDKGE